VHLAFGEVREVILVADLDAPVHQIHALHGERLVRRLDGFEFGRGRAVPLHDAVEDACPVRRRLPIRANDRLVGPVPHEAALQLREAVRRHWRRRLDHVPERAEAAHPVAEGVAIFAHDERLFDRPGHLPQLADRRVAFPVER
jgi:hypothetical protein